MRGADGEAALTLVLNTRDRTAKPVLLVRRTLRNKADTAGLDLLKGKNASILKKKILKPKEIFSFRIKRR